AGTTLALFPFTPVLAIPAAVLVPLSVHVGYTLVWSKRGERLREGPRPKPGLVLVGVLLAVGAVAALAPAAGDGPMHDRLALFRDRFLLGNPLGRAFSILYYRTTLYGAWPMKAFFTTNADRRPARGQPVADVLTPEAHAPLQSLGFVIHGRESSVGASPAPPDVVVTPTSVEARGERVVFAKADREELSRALDVLAGRVWKGRWLRELQGLGWAALFFAGFPVLVVVVAGACAPFVALMYKAMSFKGATIALGACVLLTVLLMILGEAAVGEIAGTLRQVRQDPAPERLARALAHPSVVVRHEAAYAASRLARPAPALVDPLLQAADDADLRVRLWAVAALGRTKSPRALDRLVARLEDRELFVRYRAAEGLGFLGMREAVGPLQKRMREGIWYEGTYAWEAIRRIESPRP
ncbi:MAG TPA: HEAT repeat domain-containing protein, partial [Planctomycetota bacterium]|nr:HEAT repeat domain-containing protein [Planctomycetota bacterium]